jgi:DNA gyrase subunit A
MELHKLGLLGLLGFLGLLGLWWPWAIWLCLLALLGLFGLFKPKTEALVAQKIRGEEIMLASANGMAVYFNEKELRPRSRGTQGVRGMKLGEGDSIISIIAGKDMDVLTITENGYGKRTPIRKYRKTHRGSKGVRTIITNERNGKVAVIKGVKPDDEIILASLTGKVVRIPVSGISLQERNSQGVRLMKLKEGDKVISVTRLRK